MKCHKIEDLYLSYVRGLLPDSQNYKVDEHMEKCENCASTIHHLQKILPILDSDVLPEPPPNTWQKIHESVLLNLSAIPKKRRKISARIYAAAAVFVFSVSLACLFFLQSEKRSILEEKNISFLNHLESRNLPKIDLRIEYHLKKELNLNRKDSSKLFSILKKFHLQMEHYYQRYSFAKKAFAKALKKGEQKDLQRHFLKIKAIEKQYCDLYVRYLKRVKFVLDKKKYARFLLITKQMKNKKRME